MNSRTYLFKKKPKWEEEEVAKYLSEKGLITFLLEVKIQTMRIHELFRNLAPFKLIQMLPKYKKESRRHKSSNVILIGSDVKISCINYLHHFSKHLITVLSRLLKFWSFMSHLWVNVNIPLRHVPTSPHIRSWRIQIPSKSSHYFFFL